MGSFEEQIAAIEAANANADDEKTPGAGDAPKVSGDDAQAPADGADVEPVRPGTGDNSDDVALELTDEDEAVDAEAGDETAEEDEDEHGRKRRSKPAKHRIAELTARLREAERKLDALNTDSVVHAEPPERPDPAGFEYGEADPKYIDALTDWKLETRDRQRQQAYSAQAQQRMEIERIQAGLAKAEAEAQEKYPDFGQRIAEAVESRGGEQLPPMLTIAAGLSPVGADIIYRLATDDDMSNRIEALARSPKTQQQFAMAFGEIEGEYLSDTSDSDLDMSDQLDMARMMGRMRARLAGKTAPAPRQTKPLVVPTNAPEPPQHRVRGGTGRSRASPEKEDISDFMKHEGRTMGL